MHDHHGLGRLAGLVVDGDQICQRGLGDDAEAGAEAERVLQAARDDGVGDADIDDVGQVVACRGLRGGKADRSWRSRRRWRTTPAEFIFSTSAVPPSGVDCASPSTGSILAPPSDLMPPAALISSTAIDRAEPALLAGIGQRAR